MTTSGPTKIPPQQIPGQPAPATPPQKPGPNVLITKVPGDLSDVKRTIDIRGQVVSDNRDGTVNIRTDKGDIQVRGDARELNLRQGDRVDVEIQPGRPPQSARVTPEPANAPPPRASQTPVDVQVRPNPPPEIVQPGVPATVSEGQTVRLQPVPPEQVQQTAATTPPEITVTTLPETTQAQATVALQDVQSDALNQIVNLAAQPAGTTQTNNALIPPTVLQPVSEIAPLTTLTADVILGSPVAPVIPGQPAAAPPDQPLAAPFAAITPDDIIAGLTQPANPLTTFPLAQTPSVQTIQLTPILGAPFRAEIAALNTSVSPAIVTPKIPPLVEGIPPSAIIKSFEKPLILQNQKAGEIPAIVVGMTAQKLPIISMISPSTGESLFFVMHMPGGTVLPGTQLTLIPQQALPSIPANAPILATVSFTASPSYLLTPEQWPLMEDLYQTLSQIMPQAARAMANVTPSPANPTILGAAAMLFIAAARGGDLTQWLSNGSVDALRRGGKMSLLSRLGQESETLGRLANEPVSQDWRATTLPMMWDNHMHKIALWFKNDSQNDQKDQGGKQTRFIFDLSLDAMGKVQIDGLFRVQRLDLILRTLVPLSAPMQQDMRRIYSDALGETKIAGELSFQNRPEQWVTITPEGRNLGVSV